MPVVAGAVVLIFHLGYRRQASKPGAATVGADDIIAIITVLLLVSLILILALADKLQPEALGTLIGGISAYVLGDSVKRRRDEKASTEKAETDAKASAEPPSP